MKGQTNTSSVGSCQNTRTHSFITEHNCSAGPRFAMVTLFSCVCFTQGPPLLPHGSTATSMKLVDCGIQKKTPKFARGTVPTTGNNVLCTRGSCTESDTKRVHGHRCHHLWHLSACVRRRMFLLQHVNHFTRCVTAGVSTLFPSESSSGISIAKKLCKCCCCLAAAAAAVFLQCPLQDFFFL